MIVLYVKVEIDIEKNSSVHISCAMCVCMGVCQNGVGSNAELSETIQCHKVCSS